MAAISAARTVIPVQQKKPFQAKRKSRKSKITRSRRASRDHFPSFFPYARNGHVKSIT